MIREDGSTDEESSDAPEYELTKPVFFIGFMGAGKTSVARRLARRGSVASVDMDTYIERCTGKKVSEIFSEVGEEGFRDIESETLLELANRAPLLVSCGGGVVLKAENRKILGEKGFVVYLEVSVDEAAKRIDDVSTRPLFNSFENASRIYQARIPLYEEAADIAIDTTDKDIDTIAWEVEAVLRKEGILWQAPKSL